MTSQPACKHVGFFATLWGIDNNFLDLKTLVFEHDSNQITLIFL